jgi:hypothetical protein
MSIKTNFEPIGWTSYTRADARAQQIHEALRSLAKARNLVKGELQYPVTIKCRGFTNPTEKNPGGEL